MKIQILGTGCPKCKALEANARAAASAAGVAAEFEKVTDVDAIMNMGVMMTPALAVDGQVKSMGRILSKDQIAGILSAITAH
jgi:small redox-active disulfide protein 2